MTLSTSKTTIIIVFLMYFVLTYPASALTGALTNQTARFSDRATVFSLELLHATGVASEHHLVISPLQVWRLLAVLALGARGKTRTQISEAANLPKNNTLLYRGYQNITAATSSSTSEVQVTSASYIFFDKRVKVDPKFSDVVSKQLSTNVLPIDFNNPLIAAVEANAIISQTTRGKISEALYPQDFQGSKMIMSSVIYFKGAWTVPFNVSDTNLEVFYDENSRPIGEVNMMYRRGVLSYSNVHALRGHVLELPYGQDHKFSLLIILPHYGVTLADMYLNFQNVSLNDVLTRIEQDAEIYEGEESECWLPRFQIMSDVVLNRPLNHLGIYDMFDAERANLSLLASGPGLYVSRVTQKAILEVTEEGTTAAAVTIATLPDRTDPPKFKANRPFLYMLIEKTTQSILFGGFYSKPGLF